MSIQEVLKPTASKERINSVDTIRGIALLGILLMNIIGFGLYKAYYSPANSGGATGWNLNVWWMNSMFFEGTMRGMFSMLFGAGIILFTNRSSNDINGVSVTDAYFRRLGWLFIFGVIHAYLLLWYGDILYSYALIGLFAFTLRHWNPNQLIIGAIVLCLISTALNAKDYFQTKNNAEIAAASAVKTKQGIPLTKAEKKAVNEWEEVVTNKKATKEGFNDEKDALSKGYFSIVMHRAPRNQIMQTTVMYRVFFWDIFPMMLLGMAFLKNGILTAVKSNRYYWAMALAGYGIGLTTNYLETDYLLTHQFEIIPFYFVDLTHELGRVFTTLGHIGFIMLFIKSGLLPFLQRSLAAVGQMAFTNYIMQTIICNIIFMGFGFAMYGKLERHELYYIVLGIWVFQLIVSPIWLRHFQVWAT
jgi:uncharacterized protein